MPSQPDPRPTAGDIAAFYDTVPDLSGRTVAVTGSTSGTGRVMAARCGERGARIVLLNRPSPRADAAADELRKAGVDVVAVACDLQRFDSVRDAAAQLADVLPDGLDVLCNNAGVMGLPDEATPDGCDVQMQTNHLSHFLLTALVWPLLRAAADRRGQARVVNHTSGARRGPSLEARYLGRNGGRLGGDGFPGFAKWRRYQQSKLANLLFTYALADRIVAADPDASILSVCAHPGPTDSGLQAKTSASGGTRLLDRMIIGRTLKVAQPVEAGAMGIVRAATFPDVANGDFFGPEGSGMPGPAVLLPPERDPAGEKLLWEASLATTGIREFL